VSILGVEAQIMLSVIVLPKPEALHAAFVQPLT
jgi:hypothetical protein